MGAMYWSKEGVLELIQLYKERPDLWNSQSKGELAACVFFVFFFAFFPECLIILLNSFSGYKNRDLRSTLLTEIATALHCSDQVVKDKLRNLRIQYHSERKRKKPSIWPFLEAFKFMESELPLPSSAHRKKRVRKLSFAYDAVEETIAAQS